MPCAKGIDAAFNPAILNGSAAPAAFKACSLSDPLAKNSKPEFLALSKNPNSPPAVPVLPGPGISVIPPLNASPEPGALKAPIPEAINVDK